jgi:hypothetical protein
MHRTLRHKRQFQFAAATLGLLTAATLAIPAAHAVKPRTCPDGTVVSDSKRCPKKFKAHSVSGLELQLVRLPAAR